MYILLIFVSAAAAVLYLLSSLIQLMRGRARAGFWGTFFIFTVVVCALIAVYATTPDPTLVRTIALGIAGVMIVVDVIFAVFELRLQPRAMKTSRAILGIVAGVLVAIGVIAFPYRLLALQALGQRAGGATGQGFGAGAAQNVALRQGQGSFGAASTGSEGTQALTVTKATEASQALETETGLKADELLKRVSADESIASLVQAHSGDLDKVKTALTNTVKQMVQDAVTAGTMQQAQADRMTGNLDQMISTAVEGQLPAQLFTRLIEPAITGQPLTGGFGRAGGQGGANGAAPSGTAEAQSGGTGGFGSGRNFGANSTAEAQSGGTGGGFGSGRNFGASGTAESTAEPGSGGGFGSGRNFAQSGANGTEQSPPSQGGSFAGTNGGNGGGFGAQVAAAPTATPTPFPTATPLPPRPEQPSPTPTNTPYVIATMTPAGTLTPGAAAGHSTSSSTGASSSANTSQTCVGYTNHNVNLRSAASTTSDVQMTVTASSQLQIDGRNDDSSWLAVTFQDKSGWMDAKYVQLVGRCDAIPVKSP